MKRNLRRIVADAYLPRILQAGCRIGWPLKSKCARIISSDNAQLIFAVIECIGDRPRPMAFSLAFGQWPELVPPVVDPFMFLYVYGGQVAALIERIDEQVAMLPELHLHQPPAKLGNHGKTHPVVEQFLSLPAFEYHSVYLARRMPRGQRRGQA